MSPTYYKSELEKLSVTYEGATNTDLSAFKAAIEGASESSIIGIGSGGSFTAASLLCNLHETYTGRVSRPSTPLEIICNPNLAAASPVFLISAEGKNPDITEALQRARRHSARTVHVLTNRQDSPLMTCVSELTNVSSHVFELADKDGYLATNSLLLDAIIIARAYGELDGAVNQFPSSIAELSIGEKPILEWIQAVEPFVEAAATRGTLVVTYSPLLRPIAADLESKLAEAALLNCQLADLRSFSHGRHLWLANRPDNIVVLGLIEPSLQKLWQEMVELFPKGVPTYTMALAGAAPKDLIAGLVAEMYLVGAVADRLGKDAGRPDVPDFGRKLYYINLPDLIPRPRENASAEETSKYNVLGARWPSSRRRNDMSRAHDSFVKGLAQQEFRAIIFDYDGTLCGSQPNNLQPSERVLQEVTRLLEADIVVGIASGRGGSVQEFLLKRFPVDLLEKLQLGLYNGGWVGNAKQTPEPLGETSEFLSHVTRIALRLKSLGVPIERVRTTHPYQVSIRFREGLPTDHMWFVIADALRQAGLDMATMHHSRHSVDILAPGISKSLLIAHVIQHFGIDPYQILTMGDQGAWPGNDSALLEHRFSVSVDMPSRRLDRGWKLAPTEKRNVDATLWYLDRVLVKPNGAFKLEIAEPLGGIN